MTYDSAGRLSSAAAILDTSYISQTPPNTSYLLGSSIYGSFGLLTSTLYNAAAAFNDTRGYDARGRLNGYGVSAPSGSSLYTWTNTHAGNGNVLSGNDSVNGSWNYTYDSLNRLLTGKSSARGAIWAYDDFGNLKSQTATSGTMIQYSNSFPQANNQPSGYCFDAAGNQLDTGSCQTTHAYSYDGEDRLATSGQGGVSYLYGATGERMAKYTGSVLTNAYLYDDSGHMVTALDGNFKPVRREVFAGAHHLGTYNGTLPPYNQTGNTAPETAPYYLAFYDWVGTERMRANTTTSCERDLQNQHPRHDS